ncbi:MAG: superoxide dismutase [Elusimicrobia bacterium]|nr:superoxide dismutase [Elusimicrobiota bacterium]
MVHTYQARKELRPRNLDGISEDQVSRHWSLYEGYVKNVNLLNERIDALARKGEFGPEFAEMKRRLGFEYDGMILHEHYFSVLKAGQPPLSDATELAKQLKRFFGGFESWRKEFSAIGKMRGIGWAILYFDPEFGVLSDHWITLHEHGHPAGYIPILVMDAWEHAYMVDYGAAGRSQYVETFLRNVDWAKVEQRLKEAMRYSQMHAAV